MLLVVGCSCLFSYFSKLFVKSLFFAMCGLWSLSVFSLWSSHGLTEISLNTRSRGAGWQGGGEGRKGKRKTSLNLCRLSLDQGTASVLSFLQLRLTPYFLLLLSLEVRTKMKTWGLLRSFQNMCPALGMHVAS